MHCHVVTVSVLPCLLVWDSILTPPVDRHILDNDKTLALSTRDNSIMWNMARGEVSFVVWLYSIVLVRDGMRGLFDTEDARSWYNEALKKIRGELADQMQHGNFSDHLINALACIQATSVSPSHHPANAVP